MDRRSAARERASGPRGGASAWAAACLAALALAATVASTPSRAEPVEVVVCESHQRALAHWRSASLRGLLPRHGVTVVHFDGHPDLAVPLLEAPDPASAEARLEPDLSSFQLAAAWLGLVGRIVWIRPAWARQLPDGERRFRLGRLPSGELRVDDTSDYYVLDGGYAATASLRDSVEVRVHVLSLDEAASGGLLATGPVVLDIDLDGFATRNPGADALRRAGLGDLDLEALRRAFDRERLALPEEPDARVRAFSKLEEAVAYAAGGTLLERIGAAATLWRLGVPARGLFDLARILARDDVALDSAEIFTHGRDLLGLPEHQADQAEIEATARRLADLVATGRVRPALVTIARSVEDGFTPRESWPAIEWTLLRALAQVLGPAQIGFDAGLQPAPREAPSPPL